MLSKHGQLIADVVSSTAVLAFGIRSTASLYVNSKVLAPQSGGQPGHESSGASRFSCQGIACSKGCRGAPNCTDGRELAMRRGLGAGREGGGVLYKEVPKASKET